MSFIAHDSCCVAPWPMQLSTRQHEDMAMAYRPLPMSALAHGIDRPLQLLPDPLIIGICPCFLF